MPSGSRASSCRCPQTSPSEHASNWSQRSETQPLDGRTDGRLANSNVIHDHNVISAKYLTDLYTLTYFYFQISTVNF